MNLTFRLRFATQPGQSLALAGGAPLPGHPVPMQFRDTAHWAVAIPLPTEVCTTPFSYDFIFRDGDAPSADWWQNRSLRPADFNCAELLVIDSWNDPAFYGNAFATAPFKNVLLAESFSEVKLPAPKFSTHTFHVKAPLLKKTRRSACSATARRLATGRP